jgi:hypothetical protein
VEVSGQHDPRTSGVSRIFTAAWTKLRRLLSPASCAASSVGGMHKLHVTVIALLVAIAAVLGSVALTRTTGLGSAARKANDAAVSAQTKQLAVFAAKLQKELKAKPPPLPRVPKARPVAAVSQTPRIVYNQPPPVVHVIHHHGDDGSQEADGGGGGDG